MSFRLLIRASCGWRCAMGIAGGRVAWGGAVSWGLLTQPLSGWRRVLGIAGSQRSGEPKGLILKGRACTESKFLGFGPGPGVREVQTAPF